MTKIGRKVLVTGGAGFVTGALFLITVGIRIIGIIGV
jgi:hypothetical protein